MQKQIFQQVIQALEMLKTLEDASAKQRFFKTGPGEYGEGDLFWGISVPDQRKIARQFKQEVILEDIRPLITHPVHEVRLTALFLLVHLFDAARKDEALQQACVEFYLSHLDFVNNWDLVDSSAHKILGPWLMDKDRSILYILARSGHLWRERVAIISTMYFIYLHDFSDALDIAYILLHHPHDLIHKAVGWMLREIGKRDRQAEEVFLMKHYHTMPRTMLRYAIEKFPQDKRKAYLEGNM